MTPYYPARDGYPSMSELEDYAGTIPTSLRKRSFVDRPLTDRLPVFVDRRPPDPVNHADQPKISCWEG